MAEQQKISLNIGIIAHVRHAITEPFAGGLESHTACLVKALTANGHFVTLFSAGDETIDENLQMFCRETEALSGQGDGGFAYEHIAYHDLMQSIARGKFDIIHNNSLHYLPIAMADQLGIPMVTTLHTPPFWEMAGSIQLSPHANSFFVAVSPSIGRSWSRVMMVDCVIPNGVDLKQFAFRATPDEDAYLFWSGRIVPEKGLHLAIDAARLAGIPLRFAGPVADAAYFKSQIEPRLGEQAKFLGHLNHADLTALKGGARACLCTPIWEEPYGLVVAEALACGTPIAGFARGALPDLIDGKSGILVEPNNVSALAKAVLAVQALSRLDCRRRAEEVGDAGKMIQAYEALYHRLCGAAPAQSGLDSAPSWYGDLVDRKLLRSHYLRHLPAAFSEMA